MSIFRLPTRTRLAAVGALLAASALALAGCTGGEPRPQAERPPVKVAAAFYPLAFVAERVGGDHVDVTLLTQPGVEPHDMELSPVGVRAVREADVVLYLEGFQPAIEDAIKATDAWSMGVEEVVAIHDTADSNHDGIADYLQDPTKPDHGHGERPTDPHFWLNPLLMGEYAHAVASELGRLDPEHEDFYRQNANALYDELSKVDQAYEAGLASCERDILLVSHEAYGFMTAKYQLHQKGLSGLVPNSEPSPARLKEIRDLAAETGATTVFTESLVDPAVAEAFATDAGLTVAHLDPIEGLTNPEDDYTSIMYRNLDALKAGLGCA